MESLSLPENYPDFSEYGDPPCSQSDPDSFFPEEVEEPTEVFKNGKVFIKIHSRYRYEREAKAICNECPYKIQCLEYALSDPSTQGIWGGLTENQRRIMRKNLKSPVL